MVYLKLDSGIINKISIDEKGDVLNPDTLVLNFQNQSGDYKLVCTIKVFASSIRLLAKLEWIDIVFLAQSWLRCNIFS